MMFKKYVIAVLITAGFSVTAMAQDACCVDKPSSVQVYGRLDVGVVNANSVQNSAGQTAGITQVTSSPMYTSHIGFKATEKLSGQTEVYARIESQINPADGSQGISSSSAAANGVFAREANIGIVNKEIGTFIIGRQVNPAYQAWSQGDVRGPFSFGSSLVYQSDGSSFGGTATAKTGISTYTGGSYISNAVSYITPDYNGLKGVLLYGSGNTADNTDYNQKTAIAAVYDKGMFTGTTGYQNTRSSTTGSITGRYYWVGGGIRPTDKSLIKVARTVFENPMTKDTNAANSQWQLDAISGEYKLTERVKVWAGYYMMNDQINSANKNTMTSLGSEYELSKRTQIYTAVSFVENQGTAGWAGYGGGGANYSSLNTTTFASSIGQGKNQTAYTVGMVHRF